MSSSQRKTGTGHSQKVRASHQTITTVAADLLGPRAARDILIQNNHASATVYLYLAENLYRGLRYTSGGVLTPGAGDKLTGATSGAIAYVDRVILDSGTFAGDDAVGVILLRTDSTPSISGTFESENLNLADSEGVAKQSNIATIAADRFRCDSAGDYAEAHLSLRFESGGTTAIAVGDTVTGETGGATGRVRAVTIESGTWAGDNAVGELSIDTKTGTFQSETLKVGASLDLATITADTYTKGMILVLPGGGSFQMNDVSNAVSALASASNEDVAVTEGR